MALAKRSLKIWLLTHGPLGLTWRVYLELWSWTWAVCTSGSLMELLETCSYACPIPGEPISRWNSCIEKFKFPQENLTQQGLRSTGLESPRKNHLRISLYQALLFPTLLKPVLNSVFFSFHLLKDELILVLKGSVF